MDTPSSLAVRFIDSPLRYSRTAEESATPNTWECSVHENGKTFDLMLSRLDKKDELCGFFEDGSGKP